MVGFWSSPQILPLHLPLLLLLHEVIVSDFSRILHLKRVHLGVVLDREGVSLVFALLAIDPGKGVVEGHVNDLAALLALSPFVIKGLNVLQQPLL